MTGHDFHWTAPADHPALPGHFPGRPMVPGVVLLDRAILCADQLSGGGDGCWHIGHAKFFSPVSPGQALIFRLQAKAGGFAFSVRAGGREVAAGSLTAGGAS